MIVAHRHVRAYCVVERIRAKIHPPKRYRGSKRNHGEEICYQF